MGIFYILLGIGAIAVVFLLYCCLRAGAMGDEHMEELEQ